MGCHFEGQLTAKLVIFGQPVYQLVYMIC